MNWKSRPARCAMFVVSPVSRLSKPMTLCPRSSRASARCDPMKPATPVMTVRGMCVGSDRSLEAAEHGHPHDLDVESDGPVLDVVEVVLDTLLERRIAAPAVDLGPARDAGFDLVAQHVLRDPMLELFDEERALGARPHDRHVADQHVPELRQFVEIEPTQPAPHG